MLDSLAAGTLKPTTVCLNARVVLEMKAFWVWLATVGNVRRGKQEEKHCIKRTDALI